MTQSTDLLGDPIPAPPAMTDPLPWCVFQMNENEWWLARTMEEAKENAAHSWGYTVAQAEADDMFEDACAVPDARLDELYIHDEEAEPPVRRTFREEIECRVAAGLRAPEFFAGTDW